MTQYFDIFLIHFNLVAINDLSGGLQIPMIFLITRPNRETRNIQIRITEKRSLIHTEFISNSQWILHISNWSEASEECTIWNLVSHLLLAKKQNKKSFNSTIITCFFMWQKTKMFYIIRVMYLKCLANFLFALSKTLPIMNPSWSSLKIKIKLYCLLFG